MCAEPGFPGLVKTYDINNVHQKHFLLEQKIDEACIFWRKTSKSDFFLSARKLTSNDLIWNPK